MSVDVRTRTPEQVRHVSLADFHERDIPALLEHHGDMAARGFASSGLGRFAVRVGDAAFTWQLDQHGDLAIRAGDADADAVAVMDAGAWSDLVQDVRSTTALQVGNDIALERGDAPTLGRWETVLRAVTDGRPVYETGSIEFSDLDGTPLDLQRSFDPDGDSEEMRNFLEQAGYLHLRNVFADDEISELNEIMDDWFAVMTPEDDRSWWAKTKESPETCVRVTNLDSSDVDFEIQHHPGIERVLALPSDEHALERIDLLRKPVGVTEGLSDLPWHKDCIFGMHSFRCSSIVIGISVTASDESNGQLGAVAGSHRANIPLLGLDPSQIDLPAVYLSTAPGDCTVHLSCTLHCATPPVNSERRVVYPSFALADSATHEQEQISKSVRDAAGRTAFAPRP